MVASIAHRSTDMHETQALATTDEGLETWAHRALNRHPAIGLAVGVIRGDEVAFYGHGLSDIAADTPITGDTVFRIGSITKTITAIAAMQLWERGLIDLDAPAEEHLSAYRLVPTDSGWKPVTIRHLLTHTSGIPDVLHVGHLFHPSWGPFEGRPPLFSVEVGEALPSLAEYYREGVPVLADPGSAFAYSNHGFATLGQIVEEVSGEPLDEYFRQHIFEPLGMMDTGLVRSPRIERRLARGHDIGPHGVKVIADRDWIGAGGGGVYSSSRDMVSYVKALLGGGANENGSVLAPATLASMFEYQYQADARLGGIGLGFFRHEDTGHRVLGHDGILPGFNSSLMMAPDDGVGVVALTNGSRVAMAWLPMESESLLRRLTGIPDDAAHAEIPQHPEIWDRLCGHYRLPPVADLRGRVAMGGGAEVRVTGGRLMIRFLTPMPALYRGFPLIPDDENDPRLFRVDLSTFGMGTVRVAFKRDEEEGLREMHTDLGGQPISFYERTTSWRRITSTGAEKGGVPASLQRTTASTPGKVQRLTDLELVMLGASKTWPQDIGALAIFEGSRLFDSTGLLRMERIRQHIEARLHLVPRLRQIIHTPPQELGGPLWIDDPNFDVGRHLKQDRIPPPGGDQELTEAIEKLRIQPLDPTRPMWDMRFLTGLADGRLGVYIRLHHTIADGMAAMASIASLLDPTPDGQPASAPRWEPSSPPSEQDLHADVVHRRLETLTRRLSRLAHPMTAVHQVRRLWPAVREVLADKPATRTSLDRMVGKSRDLALIRSSLDTISEVAHDSGATVNDVLLTVTAGGLRALLQARGERIEGTTVRIFVPVSLRQPTPGPQQGNLIAQMVVPLRLDEPDPARRLGNIAAETKARKARARTSIGMLMHGRRLRRLMLALVMRQRVNATSASIPGPTTRLYLAGAPLLEVFPVLPLIANEPLGIGALSYAGRLFIGIAVDADAFPDLDVFAKGVTDELIALSVPSPPPEPVTRPATRSERTTQ